MSDDLISRSALKKIIEDSVSQYGCQYSADMLNMWALFSHIINDAPTVEYTFEKAFQKTVCEQRLYCPERPRGKWIDYSADEGYVECPFCHELTTCGDNIEELHYCWNCGAEMRKEEEDG